jgi:NADH dehydrogenase
MPKIFSRLRRQGRTGARIVVAGANFAGLNLALRLPRGHQVTVVDPSPHFEFLPNIHELVSGLKTPADLQLSRAALLRRAGHTFVLDRAAELDLGARRVRTDAGAELVYDVLVVAVGGAGTTFGVPGADQHAHPFRTVEDCAAIGSRLRALARGAGPRRPRVVIVGGGLEGVEALGEILRAHRAAFEVALVEGRERLLPEVSVALDAEILRRCAGRPVRLLTGKRVARVEPDRVQLADGDSLASDIVIWTGGLTPPRLLNEAGLSPSPSSWAPVLPTLQSTADPRVFVVGDAAELTQPVSKQAYHALDMGAHAARNIDRLVRGQPLEPFKPSEKPMLVSFGDLDTFMVTRDMALAGAALSTAKEGVYQLSMSQVGGARGLVRRTGKGILDLARANLGSASALGRSLNLRVIRRA